MNRLFFPLTALAIILLLDIGAHLQWLPSKSVLFIALSSWLADDGKIFVSLLSLIENVAFVNTYFPGSVAILAAMVGTSGELEKVLLVWLAATIGAVVGQFITFYFGARFMKLWPQDNISDRNTESMVSTLLITLSSFWHPHLASMACLSMASSRIDSKTFLIAAAIASAFWNIFWLAFVLMFGNIFAEGSIGNILVYTYLIVWIMIAAWRVFRLRSAQA